MKILIAIVSCHLPKKKAFREAQRKTWLKNISIDYKFFFGRGAARNPLTDEVFFDCRDDYDGIPEKAKKIYQYAVEHEYDWVFKVDDDSYVFVDRLLRSGFQNHDFSGRKNYCWGGYASGGPGFWLSSKAFSIIANEPISDDTADDRWIGQVLAKQGIECFDDTRYILSYPNPKLQDIISICDISGNPMLCYEVSRRIDHKDSLFDKVKIV
jgi:hypothetical protein